MPWFFGGRDFVGEKQRHSFLVGFWLYSFHLQKTATAVALCKRGKGLIKINGKF